MMKSNSFFAYAVALLVGLLALTSCEKDNCEDAVCDPCTSSRLILQFQDSTGACLPSFHGSAWVKGIDLTSMDTTLVYALGDSCTASLLVSENYAYTVQSGAYTAEIELLDFDYQEPIEVNDCCNCYPVSWVDFSVNGDTARVNFPTGAYENDPYAIVIN